MRETTAARIVAGLAPDDRPSPALRAAVGGWLWFMDGVLSDWLARRDMEREQVLELLLGALDGAVGAAGADPLP